MIITLDQIQNFENLYRRSFINSLAGFRQVVLVGTRSQTGTPNLAIFNSLIHLGANPALYGLISRPDSTTRDTLENILQTGFYTFNYVHSNAVKQAHQTSARYPSEISEFDAVGLTPCYKQEFFAPFVEEAPVTIAMRFEDRIHIKLNNTSLLVGSIQWVEVNEKIIHADGYIDLAGEDILISCGLDAYFRTQPLGRLTYAKPDRSPDFL